MKTAALASLIALSLPLAAQAAIERTIEKTYDVAEGRLLKIKTFDGPIEVATSGSSRVGITLLETIDVDSEAEADERIARMKLVFENDAEGVSVLAEYPEKKGFSFGGDRRPVHLRWKVTVPKTFNVDLDTSGGSIRVDDLKGNVRADTSGGAIIVGEIDGKVLADTSGGAIKVERVTGGANLDTSGGSIRVERAECGVRADTSGGSIEVGFYGPMKEASNLDTSGGGITVRVDADAAFNLVADTSGGSVTCELPISEAGHRERDHLEGKVNGGGPVLRLDTSSGNIRVLKH